MATTSHAVTATRKRVFLETLAKTGSTVAAASAATPWATGNRGGLQTFRDLRKRDPDFALAWERAQEEALARVEQEIVRRALEPPRRPVFEKGKLVGWAEDRNSADRMLLALAKRLSPEAWGDKHRVEHTGTVEHRHAHAVAVLDARDVLHLDPGEQRVFLALVAKIVEARGEDDLERIPAGSEEDGGPGAA